MKTSNQLKPLLCVVFNLLVALPLVAQTSGRIPLSVSLWSIGNDAITNSYATVTSKINNNKASALAVTPAILQQIGDEANTSAPSVVTVADINTITPAVTDAILANEAAYQAYIDANELPPLEFQASRPFSSPATQEEVQKMIIIVNALETSKSVLAQIGDEANTAAVSAVTIQQMGTVIPTVRGVLFEDEVTYQDYINNGQANFSSPATQQEVQAMVDEINILSITASSSDGDGALTQFQLTNAGIIQEDLSRKELDAVGRMVAGAYNPIESIDELQNYVDAALETLGTLDSSLETFKMYPNPATSKVVVDLDLEKISIYNVQGKKVLETESNTFDVSNFEAGFYMVKIKTNSGVINTRRLIKK